MNDAKAALKEENPDLNVIEMTKLLGERFKAFSDVEKVKYKRLQRKTMIATKTRWWLTRKRQKKSHQCYHLHQMRTRTLLLMMTVMAILIKVTGDTTVYLNCTKCIIHFE